MKLTLNRLANTIPSLQELQNLFFPKLFLEVEETVCRFTFLSGDVNDEATLFLWHVGSGAIPAFGDAASDLVAAKSAQIEVVRPFRDDRITSLLAMREYISLLAEEYLTTPPFLTQLFPFRQPQCWLVVSDAVTETITSQWQSIFQELGMRVKFIPRAGAIESYCDSHNISPVEAVLHIGGTHSYIHLPSSPKHASYVTVGTQQLHDLVQRYIFTTHQLEVGWRTTQKILRELLDFTEHEESKLRRITVRGKDTQQHLPSSQTITNIEIRKIAEQWLDQLDELIPASWDNERSVVAVGSGAGQTGVVAALNSRWKDQLRVIEIPKPEEAALLGARRMVHSK